MSNKGKARTREHPGLMSMRELLRLLVRHDPRFRAKGSTFDAVRYFGYPRREP